ncbi:methylhydantoinase [Gluconacetobacter liquefaciens]|uniref:Hydantoinase/oxoprolinase family protein n=1 Tax=Gluconacetobacter liquefaciens TaxID=89584 RepID=A0A370G2I8_GLULI|nr:hydantoinase/oxoprolinase family protein [Gluconacetobacter liquefaciens]MBB2187279.1 hydantoinase/oxoprolinase family protein [Gluconacetobacter liquefaciens]RDI36824.1 N-methylhydantoinase A [Gluconacetobacter liquefaciens]GEB38851.1 methylhydantoinase [Gluconacetobacter liquefaciens]
MVRIGIDVGGTFTDFTVSESAGGALFYFKTPSTPHDPSEAILTGIRTILETRGIAADRVSYLGHGTTVATNMIIEGKGVKTGLVTTRGFRDVLAIGRQTRPYLYDFLKQKPEPIVERRHRIEIGERVTASGECLSPLDRGELEQAVEALLKDGVQAVAISFLHSYRAPRHEEEAERFIRARWPELYVSRSSTVLPEFREFERTSTTALNAHVGPKMAHYLDHLCADTRTLGIAVEPMTIHSNGGLLPVEAARRFPVATCLSGPAAGVIGAAIVSSLAGVPDIVTFDVGGTSTDVSLVSGGQPRFTRSREVAGHPVRLPMVDITVIGAGGGSIAHVDASGGLKVGPTSAGAVPGPAAYGKGGEYPTLTDANIVLNRLNPVALLDGRLPVDRAAACRSIDRHVADKLGISTEEAAYGIIRIAAANMARAIRAVTVEQGYDIRTLALFAFGGGGPLHATEVAREAEIRRIIIPREPGTMCARGTLMSDISLDFSQTLLERADDAGWGVTTDALRALTRKGDAWLESETIAKADRVFNATINAYYVGQNHEIPVSVSLSPMASVETFRADFHRAHMVAYGTCFEDRPIAIVSAGVQAVGRIPKDSPALLTGGGPLADALKERREVYLGDGGWQSLDIYRRDLLAVGEAVHGPAIVEEMSSTTILLEGQTGRIDEYGNIIIDDAF